MPNEMNHAEVAETLHSIVRSAEINRCGDYCSINISRRDMTVLNQAAADERRIENGEYALVVHAQWKLVSEGAQCNLVKCTHCGRSIAVARNVPLDEWRAAKPYCDQCGALMGKDSDAQ